MFDRALRTVRQYHRLNQSELANKLQLSRSYLNELEKGHKQPSLDVLQKYSELFNVPVSSLMLFAERTDAGKFEGARVFAADKVLRMLEWIAQGDESELGGHTKHRKAHSA
jgi:transcriptional regulator with XRE-family HTH domain